MSNKPKHSAQGAGSQKTATEPGRSIFSLGAMLRRGEVSADARALFLRSDSSAEAFYRQRWSHDRVVRSTHGVNCTGSCSWMVYVKDGIITWETQATDYPSVGPHSPEYEPRGCPRGAAFSWYTYSPTRIRYPYIRSVLLDLYRQAKEQHQDPVLAWGSIVSDPAKAKRYKSARGKGGLVRTDWATALEIISAAHVYTIKNFGPDRLFGFSVIPAMSMISYAAGSRFYELLGGTMLSFYDWYADLPMASPQVFGDQTDVPESADWFNAGYLIMWGSNIPLTRTPDAHFMTEARYRGQKVVSVSPDFADSTKFGDEWLRVAPGTDGALAMAMGHVILSEFHEKQRTPYFLDYMRHYTDSPFLVALEEHDGQLVPGKFVTAADMAQTHPDLAGSENAQWRTLVIEKDGTVRDPGGTLADRFGEAGKGKWNLRLDGVDPVLSTAEVAGHDVAEIALPRFDLPGSTTDTATASVGAGVIKRGVPTVNVGGRLITTVYDLLLAQYGVAREGLPGSWPTGYEDPTSPGTPAWQAEITGVSAQAAIRIGREFAQNAADTRGRSMIVMGAGTNHYFHSDQIYRTFLALTNMCGCQGVNGGGWAHYVGQEKVRPITGWQQYAMALDWQRPARQMISTGFWYFATSQWRYDATKIENLQSPLSQGSFQGMTTADSLVLASQRGWMPSYPTFDRNPLELGRAAAAAGLKPGEYVSQQLRAGKLNFACTNPEAGQNHPKVLACWRTNLLGSSAKGTEFFQKHLLGTDHAVEAAELEPGQRPSTITWEEKAAIGKLDLLYTADFRNTSTTLHSDIVLPAATWYEKFDLSSTDMHPFLHSFNAAIDPPWEAKTDFELFQCLAKEVSRLSAGHLGVEQDVMAVPLNHDTPDELTDVHGVVPSDQPWIPGVTMPKIIPIERDYAKIGQKFDTIGPLTAKAGMATKGVAFSPLPELEKLAARNGTVTGPDGVERTLVDTPIKAADMVLHLSGTSNGRLATAGFSAEEARVGTELSHLAAEHEGKQITFKDIQVAPVPVVTSPEWSGSETGGRRYSAFVINIERHKPFHTLTGRQHFFLDHDWMRDMGENMPIFRPPLDLHQLYGEAQVGSRRPVTDHGTSAGAGQTEVAVRYLTPHNKWAIHSQYFDNLHMLTLSRGGQHIWISPQDAADIGVKDNEWVEAYNRNGVVSARAVVSHRIPKGTIYMHHAQERVAGTPLTQRGGKRGGIHNSLTRIMIKPSHLIGAYAQHSYAFNYVGPCGTQRDEVTYIRRRSQEVEF